MALGKSTEGRGYASCDSGQEQKSYRYLFERNSSFDEGKSGEAQEMIENGTIGDYKVPIFFNNIHPDELPA